MVATIRILLPRFLPFLPLLRQVKGNSLKYSSFYYMNVAIVQWTSKNNPDKT
jgi:hypothetical protein